MSGKRQFSLRSVFLATFWAAATLGLLRLVPLVGPTRLVDFLLIDNSQRAPFVLLIPAALLVAVAATFGAALGSLSNSSGSYAARLVKLAAATAAIYFAVMAWCIWTDHYLTALYSLAVLAGMYLMLIGRKRHQPTASCSGTTPRGRG